MTFLVEQSTITFTSISAGVPLQVPFPIGDVDAVVVRYGDDTVAVLNTHYTVTLFPPEYASAEVTPTTALVAASGGTVSVSREIPYTQPTDVPSLVSLRTADVENLLDRTVKMAQQVRDIAERGLRFPAADLHQGLIPTATSRASLLFGFDSLGRPTTYPMLSLPLAIGDAIFLQDGGGVPRSLDSKLKDAVHIKDFGAVGDGIANDTLAFQLALTCGRAVDISGGIYPVAAISVTPSATIKGIFSDGTGTLVPAPGSTSATNGFVVTKVDGFFFHKLRAIMPLGTDPVVAPAFNRMFWFSAPTGQVGVNWEVTDCYIEGGCFGIVAGGRAKDTRFERNTITGLWQEGISGPDAPDGLSICDNSIHDGGYTNGSVSGAIRIGSSGMLATARNISICRNRIARYATNTSQSGIDCFATSLFNLDVSDNVIEDVGGGIEIKTQNVTDPTVANIYREITINNNTIRILPVALRSGITIFYSTTGLPHKHVGCVAQNNHITCYPRAPSALGVYGISLGGVTKSAVKNNTILDVTHGIAFDGSGPSANTGFDLDISGNHVDAVNFALVKGSNTNTRVRIHDNPLLKSQDGAALTFASGPLRNVTVERNFIWGVNTYGIELRDVKKCVIRNNDIRGGINAILSQVTAPDDVAIEDNRLANSWNTLPAVSGLVTGVGAGLTNGVRTFTVTSGTGTVPTVFQAEVTGGTVTGAVVILEGGSYDAGGFPAVPTVTVDEGVVGGATFSLTAAVPTAALALGVGTNIAINNNSIDVAAASRTVTGAGTYVSPRNVRGSSATDPTSGFGMSVGDVWINPAPATGGVKEWQCVTAGNAGAGVVNATMLQSLTSGTVTQLTDKSTAVTLNAARGTITMNNATLNAGDVVSFTLNNSHVGANDFFALVHDNTGAAAGYVLQWVVGAGTVGISVRNVTAGNLGEAIVLRFAVIKAP